jgi:pre-mRNA-splicing factor SPF27
LAWQGALENAQAQLQHQKNRILNLELLLKYGPDCWRAKNDHLATHLSSLNQQLASTQRSIDDTNKERKLQQEIAGRELSALHNEYLTLLSKNAQLEGLCQQLELGKTSSLNTD